MERTKGLKVKNQCQVIWFALLVFTLYFIYGNENVQKALMNKVKNLSNSRYLTNDRERSESKKCKIPILDPFDQSVMNSKSMEEPEMINCRENYSLLFQMDLSSSKLQYLDRLGEFEFKNCCYKLLNQSPKLKSNEITFNESKECILIKEVETEIELDFNANAISIYCQNPENENETSLVDIFPLIRKKASVENRLEELKNSGSIDLDYDLTKQYNVVVLGLDSISHMNFKRSMPKTRDYIMKDLEAIEMNGLTKVGHNTFPILIPGLTGRPADELKTVCFPDIKKDSFDHCPFLWTDFQNKGYYTIYFEDAPKIGIFNYLKRGFKGSPVDYFFEPFFKMADEKLGNHKPLNANFCYGPRLAFEIMLDLVRKMANFIGEMKSQRYFEFMWATSLFHDYINYSKLGDEILLNTIKWMETEGHLKQTVLILMSDHGIRWSGISDTIQGQLEARMPFIYFIFPQKFYQDFNGAIRNLKSNDFSLITHYDFYQTMKDLLDLRRITDERIKTREGILRNLGKIPRGISLFLPIPNKRSCNDAGIPMEFCICHQHITTSAKDWKVDEEAAKEIVKYLNELLKSFPQCAQLVFKSVLSSQRIFVDLSDDNTEVEELFGITVAALPGRGVFESYIGKKAKEWNVKSVIRTSNYGNDSICANDSLIKNYCYCKSLIPKIIKTSKK